jgi:hypothetical protein
VFVVVTGIDSDLSFSSTPLVSGFGPCNVACGGACHVVDKYCEDFSSSDTTS